MEKHFTHLHLHTDYSLLDGAISIEKLIKFGKEQKMKAMAITDHGNVFGAVKFFQKCKSAGIKPILGMEAYTIPDIGIKNAEKKYYHLIILVENEIGYKNLCKLISFSFKEGFYFKPRIDYRMLEKHSEGLIITSACLGGHLPQLLMNDRYEEANQQLDWFLNVFGPERFYLEVQPEDQKEQVILNNKLFDLSAKRGVNLVAAGDCHYPTLEDHEAHEIMLSIQTHNKLSDPGRYSFGDCRVYMRTQQEMLDIFAQHEDAVWNSGKIADRCNFEFQTGKLFFPKFEIPQEYTPESFFKRLCNEGLQRLKDAGRIPLEQVEIYDARLELEAELIITMGFVGYFLVVGDFIQWSRRNNIPVGPGRGSAAGSLVAWALEITNIDPIKYNLLFERFLNPERVTMPDIDIDFCIEGRESVINYVRDKYGHDKVCQIITFGTMMAKGVIKDVARVLEFPFEDSNALTNLIPNQLKISLKEALEQEPKLGEMIESNPRVKKVFDVAFRLEGLTRHASKHAAGIVISPDPIDEVLPVYIPAKTTDLVTQYAMTELESIGYLKMDLLGLKNLTLIKRALNLIEKNHYVTIDIDMIPLDDPKSFDLLCQGNTAGVFQFESSGLQEVLRKLQPEKFEDIIAVNALYRPGPLGSGMVDDFIERKHGRQKITYLFPELEEVLKETYGVIVYQEQVMKIASTIGGYSLGEADILRRAMGKKKAEVMAEQREIFLNKAIKLNFDGKKAGELFDLMAYFAGYGFNKSHSAAYGLIAYQTAYLKANYPAEFMACLISLEATHAEKMSEYLHAAKEMGLGIVIPDINASEIDFSVVDGKILFGLQGIKGVGLAALENILAIRAKKTFADLFDFCKRIDLRTSNKRVLESLICAGAFDKLSGTRAQKFNELTQIMERAAEEKKREATGQMDLFGMMKTEPGTEGYAFQTTEKWTNKETLEKEKEVIGFYLSSHPLDTYRSHLKRLNIELFTAILEKAQNTNSMQEPIAVACGLIKGHRVINTKKGDKMAFVQLEDSSGGAEIVLFPKTYAKVEQWLETHTVFVIKGAVDIMSQRICKIKANDFVPVELLLEEWPKIEHLSFTLPNSITEENIQQLKKMCDHGNLSLWIHFNENGKQLTLLAKDKITVDTEVIKEIEKLQITVNIAL